MRLIDGDALIKRLDYCVSQGLGGNIAYMFKHMVDEAPTVDAVPVEWIEIDIEQSAFSGYDMHSYEVATMLEEWKEKERKEE